PADDGVGVVGGANGGGACSRSLWGVTARSSWWSACSACSESPVAKTVQQGRCHVYRKACFAEECTYVHGEMARQCAGGWTEQQKQVRKKCCTAILLSRGGHRVQCALRGDSADAWRLPRNHS